MTHLYGAAPLKTVTATTHTVSVGDLNTVYFVTPNASNTTITLPASGRAGQTVRFVFAPETAVGRYCDVVVTGAETFKTLFSSAAKAMRFWTPCDVTFLDNGTKWTAFEGSCYDEQRWFVGETEGTLGHGLFEVLAPGQITGAGFSGEIRNSQFTWHLTDTFAPTAYKSEIVPAQSRSSGDPLWYGTSLARSSTKRGMFSRNAESLVPSGSLAAAAQFVVFNFHSGDNFSSHSYDDKFYSNHDESVSATSHSCLIGMETSGTNVLYTEWRTDASNYTHKSHSISNSTDYCFVTGFDAAGGYSGLDGAALAATTDSGTFAGTDDVSPNPVGILTAKDEPDSGVVKVAVNTVFIYHGRDRWTDAETAEFYSLRAGSGGKVLL